MRAIVLTLVMVLGGCPAAPDQAPLDDNHAHPPPTSACFIAGGSFEQCYDDWPLFDCVPPNEYLQGTTCATEGLCQDKCSGTWVDCSRARATCAPPPPPSPTTPPPSRACVDLCEDIFACRDGEWFYFLTRVDPDNCASLCARWDANRIECAQRQSCPYLQGSPPACFYTPDEDCDDCLDSCRGLPGCCQGTGCICDSAC